MSFLAPLFLLGSLAIALPVLFHLARRTTRKRAPFGSLMFLRPAPPRLRERNRIENLLLLLLRCAAICLLAFGFARPFLISEEASTTTPSDGQRLVVLLDTSASMGRGDLWRRATDQALAALRRLDPRDEAAVLTYDRTVRTRMDFAEWNQVEVNARISLARERLAAVQPGHAGTHLDQALIRAAEVLEEGAAPGQRRPRIRLISDLQQGSHLNGLQAHEWPRGIEVEVDIVGLKEVGNAGLQAAGEARSSKASPNERVRLRVANASDSEREQFQVGWVGSDGAAIAPLVDVHVPPGQSRVITLEAGTAAAASRRARLLGDAEPFDNEVFLLAPPVVRSVVLCFGEDTQPSDREHFYFLQRAFQETPRQAVAVLPFSSEALPTAEQWASTGLLVLIDPTGPATAREIRQRVAEGATLLLAPRTDEATRQLFSELGLGEVNVEEASAARYALLGEIDFQHPIFAPFADVRYSDFTKIHFWRHRRIETDALAGARVLARFDDDAPALIEVPTGPGRVLLLTSGWQPEDSQLALSSKFVPLLYSLLEYSGARPPAPAQYTVGDLVTLDPLGTASPVVGSVTLPDERVLPLAAGMTDFSDTAWPGFYSVRRGTQGQRFAVNLDPLESQTTPLLAEDLAGLGVPTARSEEEVAVGAARQVQLQRAEMENRQKLWRWLVLATLVILVVETWLAGRGTPLATNPTEASV